MAAARRWLFAEVGRDSSGVAFRLAFTVMAAIGAIKFTYAQGAGQQIRFLGRGLKAIRPICETVFVFVNFHLCIAFKFKLTPRPTPNSVGRDVSLNGVTAWRP